MCEISRAFEASCDDLWESLQGENEDQNEPVYGSEENPCEECVAGELHNAVYCGNCELCEHECLKGADVFACIKARGNLWVNYRELPLAAQGGHHV